MPANRLGVWVEAEQHEAVGKGILVLGPRSFGVLGVGGANDGLDLCAVDQPRHVRVGNLGRRKPGTPN